MVEQGTLDVLLLMFEAPAKQWLITVTERHILIAFLSSVFLQEIIFSVKFLRVCEPGAREIKVIFV